MLADLSKKLNQFNYLKSYLEFLGFGHAYHDLWWRLAACKQSPLTDWNYNRKVIFIHVPKTAGLSIYSMFGMQRPFDTHVPVAGYQQADPVLFKKAFKFAVVRNPWDRVVSAFHHLKFGTTTSGPMEWHEERCWADRHLSNIDSCQEFLSALRMPSFRRQVLIWRHFIPQHYFLTTARLNTTHSVLLVDRVVRFENIEDELYNIAKIIGLPFLTSRKNTSERGAYQNYYNNETRDIIGSIYARDIKLFGYSFTSAAHPNCTVECTGPTMKSC